MKNNLNGQLIKGMQFGNVTKRMYETNEKFELNNAKATSEEISGYNESNKEYKISRTSNANGDRATSLLLFR